MTDCPSAVSLAVDRNHPHGEALGIRHAGRAGLLDVKATAFSFDASAA